VRQVHPGLAASRGRRFAAIRDVPSEPPLWLRREVPAVLLLALAFLSLLVLLVPGGWVGSSWHVVLQLLLGRGAPLAPLVLAAFGAGLLRQRLDDGYQLAGGEAAGWLATFLSALGLLQTVGEAADPLGQSAGGALGWLLRTVLAGALGAPGATAVIVALGLAGTALALALTPAALARWVGASFGRLFASLDGRLPRRRGTPAPAATPLEPRPVSKPVIRRPAPGQAVAVTPSPPEGGWELPPLTLLHSDAGGELSQAEISRKVELIERALADFDVAVRVVEINPGPTVTQFGLEPGFRERRDKRGVVVRREKIKVSEITSLANDLALALAAPSIRIEAPVPGREFVGVEVPNSTTALVNLQRLITTTAFQKTKTKSRLAVALGEDVSGQAVAADLARMPHLLIAGQTGSGKSVCVNSIIACLLLHTTPDELRLILVDPKRVELTGYNDVPHLLRPVVVEADKVVSVLKWVVHEMEERYKLFERTGVRNVDGYNKLAEKRPDLEPLHYIVLIVDELADLMMLAPDEVERSICRLAQLARATGIHLIIATQRPSVDVITGLIKANFPTRISFAVASQVDSRTILDTVGAEKLLGRGDMLYLPQEAPKPIRLQGTYVSDEEIDGIVEWWKRQGPPSYVEKLVQAESYVPGADDEPDELYGKAVELAEQYTRVSASLLQRKLRIGYSRAARLMDRLEEEGVVGASEGGRSREVLRRDEGEAAGGEDAGEPGQGKDG